MSAENLLKILEIFNKPLHLAVIGLFLILWGKYISDKNTCIFVGIMCILYSICECIAQWWKKRTAHKEDEKRKIQKLKMEEKKRQEIINSYLGLPLKEKRIIDFCCLNNSLCYFSGTMVGFYDNEKSLCARGFGKIQGLQFIMDKTFFDILRAYIVKKPVGQNRKKQKKHAKK